VSIQVTGETRPRGLVVVALLMILFGLAEVVTAFTHNFFGIMTSHVTVSSYAATAIGAFYVVAGVLILTMKQWAAALALVVTGLFPLNSLEQIVAIVFGTAIAAVFAVYIGSKWRFFRG
jgi:hypothetical protein